MENYCELTMPFVCVHVCANECVQVCVHVCACRHWRSHRQSLPTLFFEIRSLSNLELTGSMRLHGQQAPDHPVPAWLALNVSLGPALLGCWISHLGAHTWAASPYRLSSPAPIQVFLKVDFKTFPMFSSLFLYNNSHVKVQGLVLD